MPSARQRFGSAAEEQAADFLRAKGMHILDRHVTSRYGEIDILARDGQTLVAVEVKARRSRAFGPAIAALTPEKLERLRQALADIMARRGWESMDFRIDFVAVDDGRVDHFRAIH